MNVLGRNGDVSEANSGNSSGDGGKKSAAQQKNHFYFSLLLLIVQMDFYHGDFRTGKCLHQWFQCENAQRHTHTQIHLNKMISFLG